MKEYLWNWRHWDCFLEDGKYWAERAAEKLGPFDSELECGTAIGEQFSYGSSLPYWLEIKKQ